ncbi:MAG: hypothetical protein C0623_05100 [Desulfuromonas sp.]|nr:MAG: hypothetical protein C0623_05100 [Desulfuromonas sp.]
MRKLFLILVVVLSFGLMFLLTACEQKGPAEKAGAKIDEAVEQTKDKVEEAKETIEDKLTQDGPMEEAGEKIDEAAEEVKESVKESVK